MARTPQQLAESVVNLLCQGDPYATAQRLADFQGAFVLLAAERLCRRVLSQYGHAPEWPPKDELASEAS